MINYWLVERFFRRRFKSLLAPIDGVAVVGPRGGEGGNDLSPGKRNVSECAPHTAHLRIFTVRRRSIKNFSVSDFFSG